MPRGATTHDRAWAFPPSVGRYPLLAQLGSGGMASVFLGRVVGAGGFERDVAVKILHPHLRDVEDFTTELLREAHLAARIRHPNVVQVLDVGEDPNGVFVVMDYIEGDTLGGLMKEAASRRSRVPPPIALRILSDALAGLQASHEVRDERGELLGLVHRDFTPQNILVGTDGIARLTDFGIAKVALASAHTRTGLVKGKLTYLAPEQVRGHAVDRRADVWAAGVIAWELFSGKRLFKPRDEFSVMLQIVDARVPTLAEIGADVPPAVVDVVAKALRQKVDERCASAAHFCRALCDAWRARDGGDAPIADASEVARYVATTAGEALEARRKRIAEHARPGADREGAAVEVAADPPNDDTTTLLASSRHPREAEPEARRGRRRAAIAIGASTIVAAVAAGALLLGRSRAPTEATAIVAPASSAPVADPPLTLHITSNAAMARLVVAGRDVPITHAVERVDVDVDGRDPSGTAIEAWSVDGRTTTRIASAAATAVALEFATDVAENDSGHASRGAEAATATSATGSPKSTSDKPRPRARPRTDASTVGVHPLPLSPSPYDGKP